MSTTHTVSLLQWQQTYDLFTEHIGNTHSEPATKWHSTHSILPSLLPPYQTLRIDKCMSLRKWSMSVRSLAAEYSLWQLRTGRPTGYRQSKRTMARRLGKRLEKSMENLAGTQARCGYISRISEGQMWAWHSQDQHAIRQNLGHGVFERIETIRCFRLLPLHLGKSSPVEAYTDYGCLETQGKQWACISGLPAMGAMAL
ncbi:hypothetical protein HO133_008880 [Letharia lupina]|uniref:Uncharacterized protein n=1 Tax=Letharia lupina TaxID=560253 RepID=A0A8H6FGN7_9LECA|nr:uncharacterized protein HO133_008880 [Letharia lupina]KAF6227436.1 hypothetical protein HO133_008880 [Letharia lupina]